MTITKEVSLYDFEAWSGGLDTLNRLKEHGVISQVENYLEEVFCEGATETDINDFLWFEEDLIYSEILEMTEEEYKALPEWDGF